MGLLVRAAGGIVVRDGCLLLVHRPKYDDWSFPKGKLEDGETWKDGALREVEEETGLRCSLGEEVGRTHYGVAQGPKEVRYYRMACDGEPRAQNEVDEARAMSVLVDERFGGSWDDLRVAHSATTLPLLAKGFFSTPADFEQARDAGADAVLILLRDLNDAAAAALLRVARTLGLDTLVEAHDADELARAAKLDAPVIGVNARDLSTFSIDRAAQLELVARACASERQHDRIVIAESGIATRAQAAAAELAGANAILVGSTLMRAADPGDKLRELVSRPLVKVCGLTRQVDVDMAVEAGADMVGFILAAESPRRADALLEAPDTVLRVAVFVGETEETDADLVQFYGRENGHRSRDAVLLRAGKQVGTVVDLPWAENDPSHLERAKATPGRVMLAGGLGPANVAEAIAEVRPWAVDSARSTERAPGLKHHGALRHWVEAARVEAAR